MPQKRTAAGDQPSAPSGNKARKLDHEDSLDFSSSVKKRLSSSSRTGQACDRCKVRKIRCDGRSGGCSPCLANNTACKTTDRITGRATTRGHTEALEIENSYLKQTISELQAQLKELGKDVKIYNDYMPSSMPGDDGRWPPASESDGTQGWEGGAQSVNNDATTAIQQVDEEGPMPRDLETSLLAGLPPFKPGCIEGNFLGITADSFLSPVKGMSLSFFGTEVDLSDFIPPESDDASSPLSYGFLITHAFNKSNDVEPAPLASYEETKSYATWYFGSMNMYTPVMSQPSFMKMLWKFYNEPKFKPTPAQTVMVHGVLATIKYQIALRNTDQLTQNGWHLHYRYALTFYADLVLSHSLEDVQALTILCLLLRNLPKPGPAWIGINITLAMALELGLHRSVKTQAKGQKMFDTEEVEMRKRTFWVLYTLLIGLYGKLGRPIPIRTEDIDVELPESYTDASPQTIDPRKCPFQVAIEAAKIAIIYGQMYRTIYAVHQSPQLYEHTVKNLELELKHWKSQVSVQLADPYKTDSANQVHAFYLELFESEIQLLTHHPATCRTSNQAVISSNMDICLKSSSKLLRVAYELHRRKSLDTPWMSVTVYLAAIFTTLYIHSARKDDVTSEIISELREEMDKWVEIMAQVGIILGSGLRLQIAIANIVNQSLENISSQLVQKPASAPPAVVSRDAPKKLTQAESSLSLTTNDDNAFQSQYAGGQVKSNDTTSSKGTLYITQNAHQDDQTPSAYPHAVTVQNELSYTDPNTTAQIQHFTPQRSSSAAAFDNSQFTHRPSSLSSVAPVAPMNSTTDSSTAVAASAQFNYALSTAATPNNIPAVGFAYNTPAGQHNAWREWTQSIMSGMSGMPDLAAQTPEYMGGATALMALGNPRADGISGGGGVSGGAQGGGQDHGIDPIIAQAQVTGTQLWPTIAYVFGPNEF